MTPIRPSPLLSVPWGYLCLDRSAGKYIYQNLPLRQDTRDVFPSSVSQWDRDLQVHCLTLASEIGCPRTHFDNWPHNRSVSYTRLVIVILAASASIPDT
jgi:hypothetical protein